MKIYIIIMILVASGWMTARLALRKPVELHFGIGLLAAFAIVTLAGLLISQPLMFMFVCFGAYFIMVRSPFDAACRFVLMTILTPNISQPIRLAGSYFGDLAPMHFYLLGFLCVLIIRGGKAPADHVGAPALLVLAVAIVGVLGTSRDVGFIGLVRSMIAPTLAMVLPFFLIPRAMSRRGDVAIMLGVLIGAGVILSFVAVFEARGGWSLFDSIWANVGRDGFMSRNIRVRGGLLRAPATFLEPTSFAVFQSLALLAAIFSRPVFKTGVGWAACSLLIGIGLVAAQSRGALIGCAIGIFGALLLRRNFGRAALAGALAACIGIGLVVLAPDNQRVAAFINPDASSIEDNYRSRLLDRGIEEGMKHFWFGDDVRQIMADMTDLQQGEGIVDLVNAYLTIFLGSGAVGLGVVVLLIIATAGVLFTRSSRRNDAETRLLAASLGGCFLALAVGFMFTSLHERNPFWLALILALIQVIVRPVTGPSRAPLTGANAGIKRRIGNRALTH